MRVVLSSILILNILLGSLSLQIGAHFCGGHLKSFALFGKAEPCSHASAESEVPACPFHSEPSEQNGKDCCNDKLIQTESLEIETLPGQSLSLEFPTPDWQFLEIPFTVKSYVAHPEKPHYLNYKPPLISADIQLLLQSFLI